MPDLWAALHRYLNPPPDYDLWRCEDCALHGMESEQPTEHDPAIPNGQERYMGCDRCDARHHTPPALGLRSRWTKIGTWSLPEWP